MGKVKRTYEKMPTSTMQRRGVLAIKYFSIYGTLTKACECAHIGRETVKRFCERYPNFKKKWDEAYEIYLDNLEYIADKRAKEGSDSLLKFLLKAGRQEKYGLSYPVNIQMNQSNNNVSVNTELIYSAAKMAVKEIKNEKRIKIPDVIEVSSNEYCEEDKV